MHKTTVNIEGEDTSLFHNADWSGDVVVQKADGSEVSIPGGVLLELGRAVSALEVADMLKSGFEASFQKVLARVSPGAGPLDIRAPRLKKEARARILQYLSGILKSSVLMPDHGAWLRRDAAGEKLTDDEMKESLSEAQSLSDEILNLVTTRVGKL